VTQKKNFLHRRIEATAERTSSLSLCSHETRENTFNVVTKNDKKSSRTGKTLCQGVFGYTESSTLMIRPLQSRNCSRIHSWNPAGKLYRWMNWRILTYPRPLCGSWKLFIEISERDRGRTYWATWKVTSYLDRADTSNPLFISTSTRRRQLRCLLVRVEVEIISFWYNEVGIRDDSTGTCYIQSRCDRKTN